MKSSLSIFILLIFVSFAVFGAFSIANMGAHNQGCWAAFANNNICPESMKPLTSVDFHLSALAKFSLAVFQNTLLLISMLAVLFIVARILIPNKLSTLGHSRLLNSNSKLNQTKFTRWLSLLEDNP